MFVSSYNTYIDTSTTNKAQKEKDESVNKPSSKFEIKATPTFNQHVILGKKLPIDYISNYKALNNKQQLEDNDITKQAASMKFKKVSLLKNAQVAYGDNSKMFSLLVKPKQTINQTPKIDQKMPIEAQDAKESVIRSTMVNAYIANDNYYRITAA
ncbi:hypothetical protein [Sulfurimonas sp.]|jgi:hypothetical protein|uniref:hypothetical protein n=1 Tax=Sulfurimonas sp. TaxID=2022749 RepID=UPI0025F85ABD|nr:hypothetical protein [Sulfurimonas sp.]MBT5934180.1 hypothetical protein [Sulfurimonas sp.]